MICLLWGERNVEFMNRLRFSSVGESYPVPDFASPLGFRRGEWMRVDRNETPNQVGVMVIAFSLASVRASPFLEPNVEMWLITGEVCAYDVRHYNKQRLFAKPPHS